MKLTAVLFFFLAVNASAAATKTSTKSSLYAASAEAVGEIYAPHEKESHFSRQKPSFV